jgi:four helix bundle protein
MRNFKKLMIWQVGMQIVDKVYDVVPFLPNEEKFGLRLQMTKSATSIPSNIAEGSAKRSQKDYLRFVEISLASSFELETHSLVVQNRRWVSDELISELLVLVEKEQKMISKFIEKL